MALAKGMGLNFSSITTFLTERSFFLGIGVGTYPSPQLDDTVMALFSTEEMQDDREGPGDEA